MRETLLSFFAPPIPTDSAQSTAKLAWMIRLRWLALGAQLLSVIPALHYEVLERHLLPGFLGVIAGLTLVNVVSWVAMRRGLVRGQYMLLFQLGADIVALSSLLTLTGGAWNPLVPILFVHAGLGAILLKGQQSLVFFALLIACLVMVQLMSQIPPGLQGALVPANILFPAQLIVAVVFWILTAWLSRTLDSLQGEYAMARDRRTRIDRLRAVGALAAGLSHEFATPLNTAQLKVARLARRPELENDEDLATAREALIRCEEVLRHMAGAPLRPEGLDLEVVNVDDLVKQVCSSLSLSHVGDNPSLHVTIDGASSRRAVIPAVAFSQAIINLIDNAVESAGTDTPIEVVVDSRPGEIDVSVMDRGKGWPEVVRSHLGQPFLTTKPRGVGLGLYFVHSLAEAVGATFQVENRTDGGAIARICLPSVPAVGAPETPR